jgi:hypothetical protein
LTFLDKKEDRPKNGFMSGIPPMVGFRLGYGLASMGLPPSDQIGGRYVRGIGKVLTGHLGSSLAAWPVFAQLSLHGAGTIGTLALLSAPLAIIEKVMYIATVQTLKPLALT